MLQKYIVAEVEHNKKDYLFRNTNIAFDNRRSSLILLDEYIKNDMEEKYICQIYSVFESMVKSGIYSSVKSIERAVKNGVVRAELNIIYTTDINKTALNPHSCERLCNTLYDIDIYCSGIQYTYSLKDKSITRYELYGDLINGNFKQRSLSELVKWEELRKGQEIKFE